MTDPASRGLEAVARGAARGLLNYGKEAGEYIQERDRAYEDRNALALAFVTLAAKDLGKHRVGWYDHGGDGWAMIYADLAEGQVSWHVPKEAIPEWVTERPPEVYDGHSREEKNERLRELVDSYGWPA